MIGRLNEWKGQDLLLEAFSDLTNDEAGLYELKIVGSSFEDNPKYISHFGEARRCKQFERHRVFITFPRRPSEALSLG